MKKTLIAAMAIVICIFTATAQKTAIGFKAGVNFATLSNDASPNPYKMKTDLHAGVLAHIHLTNQWAVQPEVVYSGQGGKTSVGDLNLGYLNVPVLVQYMFSNGFRLQTGPQAGILLSAKSKYNNITLERKDQIDDYDFAWTAGVGYKSAGGLGADARYNLGLSNINNSTGGSLKNSVIQVGLFYQFK